MFLSVGLKARHHKLYGGPLDHASCCISTDPPNLKIRNCKRKKIPATNTQPYLHVMCKAVNILAQIWNCSYLDHRTEKKLITNNCIFKRLEK